MFLNENYSRRQSHSIRWTEKHWTEMKQCRYTEPTLHLDLNFEEGDISQTMGCNLQMNFLHARLLHKRICTDSDWTQLNDPIHIPKFFTRQGFPFSPTRKSKISMFSGATSVTDWAFFFCHQPLVRLLTGTKTQWKEPVLFQG